MTMFTTFSGYFPKKEMTFFTDLIADATPFSIIKSGNEATSTIDNDNTDGVLGKVALSLASSATTYNFAGVYLSNSATAATVDRTYKLGNGEAYMEANVRMNATDSDVHTTVGFGIGHNTATAGLAQSFVGFHSIGGSTIKAVIVQNYVTVASFDTKLVGAASEGYRKYGVQVNDGASVVTFSVNGKPIHVVEYAIDRTVAGMVPQVEIRDRTNVGSGAGNQSVDIDYVMFRQKVNR